MKIINRCQTAAAGTSAIFKSLKDRTEHFGNQRHMPAQDKGFEGYIAFRVPAQLFVEVLRGFCCKKA